MHLRYNVCYGFHVNLPLRENINIAVMRDIRVSTVRSEADCRKYCRMIFYR